MMKKICIIKSRRYPLNSREVVDGGTLNVFKIVEALRQRKYEIDVFTRSEDSVNQKIEQKGIRIFRIPFRRSSNSDLMKRDYEEGKSFVEGVLNSQHFNACEYQSVNTHHWTSGVNLGSNIPTECRLIHTPHLLALEKAFYNQIMCPVEVESAERELLERANFILAFSRAEAQALRDKYNIATQKIIIAPNGVARRFSNISRAERSH